MRLSTVTASCPMLAHSFPLPAVALLAFISINEMTAIAFPKKNILSSFPGYNNQGVPGIYKLPRVVFFVKAVVIPPPLPAFQIGYVFIQK